MKNQKLKLNKNNFIITKNTFIHEIIELNKNNSYKKNFNFLINNKNIKTDIIMKIILNDDAQVKLNFLIKISKNAIGSNTKLKIECLINYDKKPANIEITPSLKVNTHQVKASHSAIIKTYDQNKLQYLYSRGLNKINSKILLKKAFINYS